MHSLHLDGQATLTDMFLKCDAIINSRKPIALIIVLRPDEHGLLAALSKKNCQMEQFNSQQFDSQQKNKQSHQRVAQVTFIMTLSKMCTKKNVLHDIRF